MKRMERSHMKEEVRNQVNVRLSDEDNKLLLEMTKSNRISKSEAVRLLLNNEFTTYADKKKVTLGEDDRVLLVEQMAKLVNELNGVRGEVNRVGNNVNQIARRMNDGGEDEGTTGVEMSFNSMSYKLLEVESGVQEIWRSLV